MAKMTLLEMTQNILSAMDSDEVNSIGDTVESMQVAEVIKETYDYITVGIEIPGLAGLIQLDATSDIDKPNQMVVPSDVSQIDWVRYNDKEITYLAPRVFTDYCLKRGSTADNVTTIDHLFIVNNASPVYYTSFDDNVLVFDAYDASEDSCLQQSKSLCWGQKVHTFSLTDTFIPTLPLDLFPKLLAEAKATCFINFKQVANAKEEKRSRDQSVRNQNNRHKAGTVKPADRNPHYGRTR